MDSDSDGQTTDEYGKRSIFLTKLPNIYTNVKYRIPDSRRPVSASASSLEPWNPEKLFPQIENSSDLSNSFALGMMCINNNAKTKSSGKKQRTDESSRERSTESEYKKGAVITTAGSSEQSASNESKSKPPDAVNSQSGLNIINISADQKQSTYARSILKPTTETSKNTAVNVITDSSEESQGTETPSRSRRVSIMDLNSDLNPKSDPLQSPDTHKSRPVSIVDTRIHLDPSSNSSEQNQITDSPRSRRVSIIDNASYINPSTGSSLEYQITESPRSKRVSKMKKAGHLNPTPGSSKEYQKKEKLQSSKYNSQEESTSNMPLHHSHLMDESLSLFKRLSFKKRGTMTLLSPTPADIEDNIRRHGPYEGELPVIRTEATVDEEPGSEKLSLRGVMSLVGHISHGEIGFEPEELVRSDPTVAKAVCELLRQYTHEDEHSLKIITLALCDNQLSNRDVLQVIEENVKGRTEDNKKVYFAIAFFISKTQDPTRIQSSNSALTNDNSQTVSPSLMRSERSVSFLITALEKYIHLAKRAASIISNESTSEASFSQHRQSFQLIANATSKMSFVQRGRRQSDADSFDARSPRQSDANSFDFPTPSGWFFDEVEVDPEIVETIRQSLPALMDFVTDQKLSLFENEDRWSQEENEEMTLTSKKGKKLLSRQKVPGPGQEFPREARKQSSRVTFRLDERDMKAEETSETQPALKAPTKKAVPNRRKKQKSQRSKKNFLGWDMTTELPPHWLKRLPKETDLIVPLLQNIQRHQLKDMYEYSRTGSRKSLSHRKTPPPTRKQVKDPEALSKLVSKKLTDQVKTPLGTRQQVRYPDALSELVSKKPTDQEKTPLPGGRKVKDGSAFSQPGSEKPTGQRKNSTVFQKKQRRISMQRSVPRPKQKAQVFQTDSADTSDKEERVDQALKQQASADKLMVEEFLEELEESVAMQEREALPTMDTLSGIVSSTPRRQTYSVEANPRESVQVYLGRHRISELFADLISNLVLTTPPNPLDTLIDRVHQLNHLKGVKMSYSQNPVPCETPSMTLT